MKKFVCTFAIIFALILGTCALSACTVTKSTGEEYFTFEYLEETDSYQISASSLEFSGAVFIPKEYQGKPVTAVKENGFSASNCNGITDVVFRATESITVGAEAFKGVKNLKTVDFYAKNVTISEKAFEECTHLVEFNLKEEAENVTVGRYAFKGTALKTVTVNAKNTVVEDFAFVECKALTSATFADLSAFEASAFNNCSALKTITSTGAYYSENGTLYTGENNDKTLVKYAPANKGTNFTVECKVGDNAFRSAVNLTVIDITGAQYVGEFAFMDCGATLIGAEAVNDTTWHPNWWIGSTFEK